MAIEGKLSRRALLALLAAGSTQVLTKSSRHVQTDTEVKIEPPYSEISVNKQVFELFDEFPHTEKNIQTIFTGGNVSYLTSDIYKLPARITSMLGDKVSHVQLFFDSSDESEDLEKISANICFGKSWYNMFSHQAQLLTVNHAARTMLQLPMFNRFQYRTHLEQRSLFINGPIKDERKFAAKLGMQLLSEDEEINTLFTYGPYLLTMDEYDKLESEDNIDLMRDIDLLLPNEFRNEVKNLGINYADLTIHSSEYAELAFGENAWTDLVRSL